MTITSIALPDRSASSHSETRSWPAVRASRTQIGIVTLVCGALVLLLIGNLGRIPVFAVGVKEAPLLLNDVVVAVLVGCGALIALRRRSLRLEAVGMLGVSFAAIGLAAAALAVPRFELSWTEFLISTAYLLRWVLYFGIYLVLVELLRAGDARIVVRVLERVVLAFALFGIFQALFLPGFAQMVHPGEWDIQGHRLVSTFLDPNFAGMFILVGLFLQCGRLAFGDRLPLWQPAILLFALVLTLSRSSFVGLIVGITVLMAVRGNSRAFAKYALGSGLLLIAATPLLLEFAAGFGRFSLDGSAAVRFISWARAATIFLDNPVLGIGFNTYGFVQDAYGYGAAIGSDFALDGGLLFVLVMTGVVGFAFYVGIIGVVIARCRALWIRSEVPFERGVALGVCAATIALVFHSVFLNSLLMTFFMETFWILWALIAVLLRGASVRDTDREKAMRAPLLAGTRGA